ncbi:hypothetical protein ES707_16039 [subsurface metagenome]
MENEISKKNLAVEMRDQDHDKLFAVAEMKETTVSKLVRSWVNEKLEELMKGI